MKRFLGMSVLALATACVPTQQASAWVNFKFGVGFNFGVDVGFNGLQGLCNGCSGHGQRPHYIATFPGMEQHQTPHYQSQNESSPGDYRPFPPEPTPENRDYKRGDRKGEETALRWGYPSLGYSYYHPVSYYPAQYQRNYNPAQYYPSNYPHPGYYQAPGMSFDR
jgi:hypothetical protein